MAQTIDNIVDPNDSSLTSEMVQFPGNAGTVSAYVSRPKDGKNLGTVIVIHENRGLIGHQRRCSTFRQGRLCGDSGGLYGAHRR
jgi:hypothetical protein